MTSDTREAVMALDNISCYNSRVGCIEHVLANNAASFSWNQVLPLLPAAPIFFLTNVCNVRFLHLLAVFKGLCHAVAIVPIEWHQVMTGFDS